MRSTILVANILVLGAVTVFVVNNSSADRSGVAVQSIGQASDTELINPLDDLSSADIAVQVARLVNLPQEAAVTNRADTVNAQLSVTTSDSTIIAKPQIVETGLKSIKDLTTYTTESGDTVSKLADRFNITSDTIRWSNGLGADDSLSAGVKLLISPVNGVVYKVKSGDSISSIAQAFSANKDVITDFNDLYKGLTAGQYIVIPDGVKAVAPVVYTPSVASFTANYGGNGYDYGYCTWWAAVRRAQIGKPIPSNLGNASSWLYLSQQAGLSTGSAPRSGAVIWTPPRDYYGHVGFVESVNSDGSVNVSEMNTAGWNVVSRKTLSPGEAASFLYIY